MTKQVKYAGPQPYVTYPGYGHFVRDRVESVSLEVFQLLIREPGFAEVKEKKNKEVKNVE